MRPVLILSVLLAAPASGAASPQEKSVKKLVKLVRYERDAKALKLLAGDRQGQRLLQDRWKEATPKQRQRFTKNFQGLFAALAFPKIRKNFEHLKSIVCSKGEQKGNHVDLPCNVVLMHALKKKEMKVVFRLTKQQGWKIIDVYMDGTVSELALRRSEFASVVKRDGFDGLIQALDQKIAKLENGDS